MQASSPDEEALVAGASLLGFTLSARSHDKVTLIFPAALSPRVCTSCVSADAMRAVVSCLMERLRRLLGAGRAGGGGGGAQVAAEVQGATTEAVVAALLEFTSDRKRMSVLLRLPGGSLRLVTKGADSVVGPRRPPPRALTCTPAASRPGCPSSCTICGQDDASLRELTCALAGWARRWGSSFPAARAVRGRVTAAWRLQMVPRLAKGQEAAVAVVQGHLAQMARSGFRTLVIAAKDITAQECEVGLRALFA